MRTNIVLDDELLREAMKLTGARTKTAAVQEALRTLVEVRTVQQRNATYRDRLDRLGPSLRALKLRKAPSEVLRDDPGPGVRLLVLDTSVAIAWYLPEAFAPAARSYQKQLLDGHVRFVVPSLHFWEMANVLRTYVKRRELTPSLAAEIYALHLDAPLEVEEPDRAEVLSTALELEATAYDAVFIALARTLDAPLLTAERKTRPWVVRLGKLVETLAR